MREDLARWQLAFTSVNHFLFVPVTIGLAFLTALLRTVWYSRKDRVALARALLADPAVLILDEPTASLPPGMRTELMSDLLDLTAGKATLLITHDLDNLGDMDEIVVLDQGRAVERGSHRELLAAPGSLPAATGRPVIDGRTQSPAPSSA